jgi:hypothetical protein
MKTISEITKLAGGAVAIAREASKRGHRLTSGSVYRWNSDSDLGIPERHWALIMRMAKKAGHVVTPDMLHTANEMHRANGPTVFVVGRPRGPATRNPTAPS